MIYTVTGSETSGSAESKVGYRGALDQSVEETSTSIENLTDLNGSFVSELTGGYELACVYARLALEASESSNSEEIAVVNRHGFLPLIEPEDELGSQPGFDFAIIYELAGVDLSGSLEQYSLFRNGFPITVGTGCRPEVCVLWNSLTEEQYNLFGDSEYDVMEESQCGPEI